MNIRTKFDAAKQRREIGPSSSVVLPVYSAADLASARAEGWRLACKEIDQEVGADWLTRDGNVPSSDTKQACLSIVKELRDQGPPEPEAQ